MTVRINKQKINLREKLAETEEKVNFEEVVRGLGEYDGNVGIGTTSPGSKLEVYSNSGIGNTQFHLHNDSAGNAAVLRLEGGRDTISATTYQDVGQLIFANKGNITASIKSHHQGDGESSDNDFDDGDLRFYTSDHGSLNVLSPRMTITKTGNVGIGTTGSSYKLDVRGGDDTYVAQFIAAYTDPGDAGNKGIRIQAGQGNSGTAGNNKWIEFYNGNGTTMIGGIQNTNNTTVAFFSGSDRRIKKNINDTSIKGIDSIKALKLRSWDWNSTEPMTSVDIGIIADELEEVYPELISRQKIDGWEHCIGEGEEDLKTIPTESKITLTLIKAVQEQQQIIDQLKSRIETLEQQ